MLYWITKPIAYIFYHIYYKIAYRGLENIPDNQPVVFAPNHVNAFIDPVILGVLTRRKIRFYARGDVFKSRIAKAALNSWSISPMFRLQEGYGEIKKNEKSFLECRNLLMDSKVVLLFPEAICIQERRLAPLKKGLSRIVFQAEEALDFKKEIWIVPVGLNYSAAWKFRSKFYIEIGKPISVSEYEARFKQDKVRAINEFTKALEQKMPAYMVIINNPNNDILFDDLVDIYLPEWIKEKGGDPKDLHHQNDATKEMAAMVNRLETQHPDLLNELKEKVVPYSKLLKEEGLRDHLLYPETISKMNFFSFIAESQIILWGSILYFFGLLTNYPPYFLAKRFSDKKVKNIEFYASAYLHISMFVWLFYFGVQLLTVALVFRNWSLLGLYAFTVILMGYFNLWYYPVRKKIFGRWRLLRMVQKQRTTVEQLINTRAEIIDLIKEAKGLFVD